MKKRDYMLGIDIFNTQTPRKRKNVLINFVFLLFACLILYILIKITKGYFLIAAMLSFFCIACPVIILFASQAILEEKAKIEIQKSHDLPIVFDQKRVIFGYIGTLFLFWILPAAVFLLPSKAWMLAGPPIWLFSFLVIKLTEHTWLSFGWKIRTYRLSQVIIFIFFLTLTLVFRFQKGY